MNSPNSVKKTRPLRSGWLKKGLFIAGIMEIMIGISHFGMPYFVYQSDGLSALNPNETDFVTLSIFAIGILLIAFGCLTLFLAAAARKDHRILLGYCVIKSMLWLGRVSLEFMYPVKVSLYYIALPTLAVMPVLIIVCLIFTSGIFCCLKSSQPASGAA